MEITFVWGRARLGAMSFARFSTDDASSKIRGYSGGGPLETLGGAGVAEIPVLQKLLRYICENGFETSCRGELLLGGARRSQSSY